MSKKDSVVSEETPSVKDVIQTLKVQYEEHLKQSDYHKTMAVKAQGALEVLLQLNPKEQEKENK